MNERKEYVLKNATGAQEICVRVIAADDEVICRKVLETEIRRAIDNVQTCMCKNASEVLQELEKAPYDVLIADILMTGMNGVELSQIVHEKYPKMQIFFETGELERECRERGIQTERVIYKPVRAEQIRDIWNRRDYLPEFRIEKPEEKEEESLCRKKKGWFDGLFGDSRKTKE